MKKHVLGLFLCLLAITLCACTVQNPMQDALTATRNTGSIKIHVHSTFDVYVITDRETVREICDTFGALELEKSLITKPLGTAYTISFCNANGVATETLTVVAGYNVIVFDDMYRVQDDFDVHAYVAGLIENAEQK